MRIIPSKALYHGSGQPLSVKGFLSITLEDISGKSHGFQQRSFPRRGGIL